MKLEQIKHGPVFKWDLWPLIPRDTIINPPSQEEIAIIVNWHYEASQIADRERENFAELRRNSLSWLLAAIAGVFGNLIVSAYFGSPGSPNCAYLLVGLLAFLFVAILFFTYWYRSLRLIIPVPIFAIVPKPRDDLRDILSRLNLGSIAVSHEVLIARLNSYSRVTALAAIRDSLRGVHPKRLSILRKSYPPDRKLLGLFVSTKDTPLDHLCDFFRIGLIHQIRKETDELIESIASLMYALEKLDFDYERRNWKRKGTDFFKEIMTWDIIEIEKQLKDEIAFGNDP